MGLRRHAQLDKSLFINFLKYCMVILHYSLYYYLLHHTCFETLTTWHMALRTGQSNIKPPKRGLIHIFVKLLLSPKIQDNEDGCYWHSAIANVIT